MTNINDMVCIKGKLKEQLVHQWLPGWESLVSYQSLATSPSMNKRVNHHYELLTPGDKLQGRKASLAKSLDICGPWANSPHGLCSMFFMSCGQRLLQLAPPARWLSNPTVFLLTTPGEPKNNANLSAPLV